MRGTPLSESHPEIAAQWHPVLNGEITPSDTSIGTKTKYWWVCGKGHSWDSVPYSLIKGGCAVCAGKRVLAGFNDLATLHPELASEWATELNDKSPTEFTSGTASFAWWRCSKDQNHVWKAKISNRTNGRGCPVCSGHLTVQGVNDLATVRPDIAGQFDLERNSPIRPDEIAPNSNKKYWWNCPLGHSWLASVTDRTSGKGCAICGNRQIQIGINNLEATNPELISEIHPTKNESLILDAVTRYSPNRVHWICASGHEWEATIINRARPSSNTGCPVCSRQKEIIPGTNDLGTTHPELAKQWDYGKNYPLTPQQVTKGRTTPVWWICDLGHSWKANIDRRSYLGQGCVYCANQKVLAGFNDLATTHPELALEWNRNLNKKSPSEVLVGTPTPYWWTCSEGHAYKASPVNRYKGKTGCPSCATGGYDPNMHGTLYFLQNEKLAARKIGITNTYVKSDRLKGFVGHGWSIVYRVDKENGYLIAELETKMLRYVRKTLQLPRYLDSESMRGMGGASETFSIDGPTNQEIISRIEVEVADLLKSSGDFDPSVSE